MKALFSVFALSIAVATIASAVPPVNEECPVCHKTARLIFHSEYKGQRVAFATAECKVAPK
jgi:hypothetical protein